MVGGSSGVPPGAVAGLLAEPQPDRTAMEVPEEEGAEPLAQDVRGDAGGGGGGAGSPGRVSGRVVDADDGAVCDRGGRASRGVRRGVGKVHRDGRPGPEGHRDSPSRHHEMTDVAHPEAAVRVSTGRHTTLKEVLDRRRYSVPYEELTSITPSRSSPECSPRCQRGDQGFE